MEYQGLSKKEKKIGWVQNFWRPRAPLRPQPMISPAVVIMTTVAALLFSIHTIEITDLVIISGGGGPAAQNCGPLLITGPAGGCMFRIFRSGSYVFMLVPLTALLPSEFQP